MRGERGGKVTAPRGEKFQSKSNVFIEMIDILLCALDSVLRRANVSFGGLNTLPRFEVGIAGAISPDM